MLGASESSESAEAASTLGVMQILETARHRLRRDLRRSERPSERPTERSTARSTAGDRPRLTARLELSLTRETLRRYAPLLAARCGLADVPTTPDSLRAAIALAIGQAGGEGTPTVTRSPAGPRMPESWLITLEDADDVAREILELASRDRGPRAASR